MKGKSTDAHVTPFRETAGRLLLRMLATNDGKHRVFVGDASRSRVSGAQPSPSDPWIRARPPTEQTPSPYRFTVFFPDHGGERIVPALRALYGGTPGRLPADGDGRYFQPGEHIAGAAWNIPDKPVIREVPCLMDHGGDKQAWIDAWQRGGLLSERARRRMTRAEYLPHVRSIAAYAISKSEAARLVLVIESVRQEGFSDGFIAPSAAPWTVGRLQGPIETRQNRIAAVLGRLNYLVQVLHASMDEIPALAHTVGPRSGSQDPAASSSDGSLEAIEEVYSGPGEDPEFSLSAPTSMVVPRPRAAQSFSIFLSHCHDDGALVEALHQCLVKSLELPHRVRCTSLAGKDYPLGERFRSAIIEDIRASKIVIGVLTRASLESGWVTFELHAACIFGSHLCLLLGPGVRDEDVPEPLRDRLAKSLDERDCVAHLIDTVKQRLSCGHTDGCVRALQAFADFYDRHCGLRHMLES
jgi:hypothetical protein